jgi:hypothetical protein
MRVAPIGGADVALSGDIEMAKDKQHKGSPKGVSGAGSTGRSGSRPQAQQEQSGDASQQDGASPREDEMLDDDAQSGSSPRSRTDAPDEAEGGGRR